MHSTVIMLFVVGWNLWHKDLDFIKYNDFNVTVIQSIQDDNNKVLILKDNNTGHIFDYYIKSYSVMYQMPVGSIHTLYLQNSDVYDYSTLTICSFILFIGFSACGGAYILIMVPYLIYYVIQNFLVYKKDYK